MKRRLILPIIGCTILCASCISTRYNNTDAAATLNYLYESSDKNLANLSKSYNSTLDEMLKTGDVKPGLCADYGVVLAKRNRHEEANKWFNRETTLYPSSAEYVYYLKQNLIPEFADDTSVFSMAKAKEEARKNSNETSIDSLTTAPRPEMSKMEKRKAARERNKAVKAKTKAERSPMKKTKKEAEPKDEPKSKKK